MSNVTVFPPLLFPDITVPCVRILSTEGIRGFKIYTKLPLTDTISSLSEVLALQREGQEMEGLDPDNI